MSVLYFPFLLHFLSTHLHRTPSDSTTPKKPVQLLQQSRFGAKICTAGIAEVQLGDTIADLDELVTRCFTGPPRIFGAWDENDEINTHTRRSHGWFFCWSQKMYEGGWFEDDGCSFFKQVIFRPQPLLFEGVSGGHVESVIRILTWAPPRENFHPWHVNPNP